VDNDIFSKLLRTLYNRDVTGAIAQLEEMVTQGRDLHQFVVDFTWYMRNLLLVKSDSNMEDVLEVTSEQMAALREEAEMMDDVMLMRFIREFSELSNQIKYSSQKRVLIEIALVKLCRPEMEQDNEALIDRINAVETKLDQGFRAAPVNTSVPGADRKSVKVEKEPLPEALPEEVQALLGKWKQVVAACGGMLKTVLKDEGTMVTYEGGKVKIVVDEIPGTKSVNADILKEEMWMDELHHIIEELTGKHVDIASLNGLYEINSDQFKDYLVHVLQSSWITFKDVPREEIIGNSFELLAEKYEIDKTDIIKTFEEALEDRTAILTWITKN
jgi:DNA polymerase-3 subunit gamma/tau